MPAVSLLIHVIPIGDKGEVQGGVSVILVLSRIRTISISQKKKKKKYFKSQQVPSPTLSREKEKKNLTKLLKVYTLENVVIEAFCKTVLTAFIIFTSTTASAELQLCSLLKRIKLIHFHVVTCNSLIYLILFCLLIQAGQKHDNFHLC